MICRDHRALKYPTALYIPYYLLRHSLFHGLFAQVVYLCSYLNLNDALLCCNFELVKDNDCTTTTLFEERYRTGLAYIDEQELPESENHNAGQEGYPYLPI